MKMTELHASVYIKVGGKTLGVKISDELADYFKDNPEALREILLKALKKKRRELNEKIKERHDRIKTLKTLKKVAEELLNSDVIKKVLKDVPKEQRRIVRKSIKYGALYYADMDVDSYMLDQDIQELNKVRTVIEILEKNPISQYDLVFGG